MPDHIWPDPPPLAQRASRSPRSAEAQRGPHPAPSELAVVPWHDPVVARLGHEPRSAYVERYWTGVIGPTSVLLLRHLAERFDAEPEGFRVDVVACARWLGLGTGTGRNAPMIRTIHRLGQFKLARRFGRNGLAVRRHLPPVARHQLERLPAALRGAHVPQGPVVAAAAATAPCIEHEPDAA